MLKLNIGKIVQMKVLLFVLTCITIEYGQMVMDFGVLLQKA